MIIKIIMIEYVSGDPLLTRADVLAIGHNARGRSELGALQLQLMQRYPVACAAYTRRARKGLLKGGSFFQWNETTPRLLFLVVRDSAVGATRLRYVQSNLVTVARDHQLYGLRSIAFAPLGDAYENTEILPLFSQWLKESTLKAVVYETYQADVPANEALLR